jgi:hypothetical protein
MTRILLLLLLASSSVFAQTDDVTLNVPSLDYHKAGKPFFSPEIFLINQRGEFLLKFNQVTRDLVAHINAEHQMLDTLASHPLGKVTQGKYNFADSDYTLVLVGISEPEKYCPPCVIQAKINGAVVKQIKDKNIRLLTVNTVSPGERTFQLMSEEEFNQHIGNLKQ